MSSENKTIILDTAERFFARKGFSASTLRSITKEANVNVASVNYYFGSKERLITEVLSRIFRPLNMRRAELLSDAIQKFHPHAVPLRDILNALIRPILEMVFSTSHTQAMLVLRRCMSEEGNFIEEAIKNDLNSLIERFLGLLCQTLPEIPREELRWRLHFVIGTAVHTACLCEKSLKNTPSLQLEDVLRELLDYTAAGFAHPGTAAS